MNNICLKKLHETQLDILDNIVQICKKHNFKYYLIGGSLLGAVRHKGFIPWDDDLDIAMPREDYEGFLKVAQAELGEAYFLQTEGTDKNYSHILGKVRKTKTLFLEEADQHIDRHHGIFVDIFPLDSGKKRELKKLKIKKRIFLFLDYGLHFNNQSEKSVHEKSVFKILLYSIIHAFPGISKKIRNHCLSGTGDCYVNHGSQYGLNKQVIEKENYDPPIELEFEGRLYSAPRNYEYILEKIYGGDYMKLPPEEKRVTHNPIRLSFNTDGPDEDMGE